jgi:hypothetical protein
VGPTNQEVILRRLGALCASALAVAIMAAPAIAHQGNPNYRSNIRSVTPPVRGLSLTVLNFDDRLQVINRTGRTVVVPGYTGEPYARLLGDGTVEVNRNSPAYYVNQDRLGNTSVPSSATKTARPRWEVLDRTGRFDWHDHRIHWMGTKRPNQIKDASKRTKIFDWSVPVVVGKQKVQVAGTLFWQPEESHVPIGLLIGGGIAVLAALAAAITVQRRRLRGEGGSGEEEGAAEAW